MNKEVNYWIEKLQLLPHPEGGFYREIYRSDILLDEKVLTDFNGKRNISTSIYYLLKKDDFSAFHRIKSDEIWHFYSGNDLVLHILHPNGDYNLKVIGNKPFTNSEPFLVVPKGCWFAAKPLGDFALVGCTVAPGFAFDDFELADRNKLIGLFPDKSLLIETFTRD